MVILQASISLWSTVSIECPAEPIEEEEGAEEEEEVVEGETVPGLWVFLSGVEFRVRFTAAYNPNFISATTSIHLCRMPSGSYEFHLAAPAGGNCEEFTWSDLQEHVEQHNDQITDALKLLLSPLSYQNVFCGRDEVHIPRWERRIEEEVRRLIAVQYMDMAMRASANDSFETKIRRRQFRELQQGH